MSGNTLIDRDGQRYNTVVIGTQRWMAENLNYQTDNDPCYANKLSNCETYGRLYSWKAAIKACPNDWHLPSDAEWDTLVNFAGGASTAGMQLKSANGWNGNGNGTNDHGFSALPGGSDFNYAGSYGYWWSASENNASHAYSRSIYSGSGNVNRESTGKAYLLSVRCVMDVRR
jgi:uncharacterized protein (TIGR02145 family)